MSHPYHHALSSVKKWGRDQSDWSVQVIEDSDGHLNIYVTHSESKKLWDVEGDHNGDELHYRITTEEIERKYRESPISPRS